jgi:hypothetical protein
LIEEFRRVHCGLLPLVEVDGRHLAPDGASVHQSQMGAAGLVFGDVPANRHERHHLVVRYWRKLVELTEREFNRWAECDRQARQYGVVNAPPWNAAVLDVQPSPPTVIASLARARMKLECRRARLQQIERGGEQT